MLPAVAAGRRGPAAVELDRVRLEQEGRRVAALGQEAIEGADDVLDGLAAGGQRHGVRGHAPIVPRDLKPDNLSVGPADPTTPDLPPSPPSEDELPGPSQATPRGRG